MSRIFHLSLIAALAAASGGGCVRSAAEVSQAEVEPASLSVSANETQPTPIVYDHIPTPNIKNAQPDPRLTPEQVVEIQLAALKLNDNKDSGIHITYRFASPGNQAAIGSLDNFARVVKNAAYRPLLNHKRATTSPVVVIGTNAEQRVTIVPATGGEVTYVFTLSKQPEGKFKDCWMTDGVEQFDPEDMSDKVVV